MQIRRLILRDVGPFSALDMRFPEGKDPKRADVHLLVGPNGTGKSSVLSAIAQCFSWNADSGLRGRLRNADATVAIEDSGAWRGIRLYRGSVPVSDLGAPEGRPLPRWTNDGNFHFYGRAGLDAYNTARSLNGRDFRSHPGVPYAVFAYGGLRSVPDSGVKAVQEQEDNPLRDACVFARPEGTKPLIQWIANTYARQAIYAQNGAQAQADERRDALSRLADALGSVIGGKVRFQVEIDPFAVLLAINDGAPVPVSLLPDGLQSLLSWMGDLLMRLDRIPWSVPGPITDRAFVLLLDEVEVHLHPALQRRVLPVVERLFPNAQIIASTHSPFVIASASDAWIHPFRLERGEATVDPPLPSAHGSSYAAVLASIMGIEEEFDQESETDLAQFRALWRRVLAGDASVEPALQDVATTLRARSEELATLVEADLRELRYRLAHPRVAAG